MRILMIAAALMSSTAFADCVPAELGFQAAPVPAVANQPMATPVVITVNDAHGNLCADNNSVVVQLAFVPGSAADGYLLQNRTYLPGNITVPVQVKNGLATFANMSFTAGGAKRLVAVDAAVKRTLKAAQTAAFNVVPFSTPALLAFVVQPATGGVKDMAWKQQPAVAIEDKFGNIVTSDNGTDIYIDVNHPFDAVGKLVGGVTKVATRNGVATFSGLFFPSNLWTFDPAFGGTNAILTAREYTLTPAPCYSAQFNE